MRAFILEGYVDFAKEIWTVLNLTIIAGVDG